MTDRHVPGIVAPLDAMLLKGDTDPSTRAIMTSALVLDAAPDFDRLLEAFERASRAVPRMRETVSGSLLPWGPAHWVPDDHFEVAHHVRQVGVAGRGTFADVLAMAGATATAPFDPARALWDAVLITGLRDGTAVLVVRLHHAIADGVRVISMMAQLLDLEPGPTRPDLPALEQRGSSLARASERWVQTASHTAITQQRRTASVTAAVLRSAVDPVGSVIGAASYLRSAVRTFGPGEAKPSPLFLSRSQSRSLHVIELPLDEVQACARAHGATVNDVFLTGLVGGVAGYHEARGVSPQDFPVSFPIDVAGDETPAVGNHFSAAVIAGPASVADPVERLHRVHDLVVSRRTEPGLDAPSRLAPVLQQAPGWLTSAGMSAYARRVDLQASNIVGPQCALYLAGTRVKRVFGFGPLPGVPVMATLVSFEGVCTIGFTIDPAAVDDPELFVRLTRHAFDELLSHGGA